MKKIKPNYGMIDGIPIWQHLKNGAEENEMKLIATDYGKIAEILGRRVLNRLIHKERILDKIFPDIHILSVKRLPRIKIMTRAKIEIGDFPLEIDYRDNHNFGKKIVIFEIKNHHFQIEQNQFRRYCTMINNPSEYFNKADELKVFFLMFDKIDTINSSASYSIKELKKELAQKVLNSLPSDINNDKNLEKKIEIDIEDSLKMIME